MFRRFPPDAIRAAFARDLPTDRWAFGEPRDQLEVIESAFSVAPTPFMPGGARTE